MLNIRAPLGYDLEEKVKVAIKDWKQFNQDAEHNKGNAERIRNMVTAEGKRLVAKQLMKMQIVPDESGFVEYHYVLFLFMKHFQKNLMEKVTAEGEVKLRKREEITLTKIRKKRISEDAINPCVEILFVMMCFKAYRRFVQKLKEKQLREEREFSEQSSDSYL